jgi:hypothetical protein
MPTATKSPPPAEFSLVSFVRSLLAKDVSLRPGEGRFEADAVARAGQELAQHSGATLRGHVLPVTRAEAGGLSTGTLGSGGAMVGSGLSMAAALQPVLQLERLGARRVNLAYGDSLASVPAVAGGGWVSEDGEIDVSEALFGAANRDPKEAAARVKISRRLFKQSGITEQEFRSLLQRTISSVIEKGILNGSGANSAPTGILHDSQLQRRDFTGASLPTRARVGELVGELLDNGADLEQVAILASSADFDTSQTGTPLVEVAPDGRRRLATVPVSFSPYIPTGRLIVADWSRVSISYVGNPQLIVNPYTYSESGILELTLFQMVSYAIERLPLLTVATLQA